MLRFGWQLTARGRAALVRLFVTAGAVAVGVAILLCVLADFHAFEVTASKPCWQCTQGTAVTSTLTRSAGTELWNYGEDIFHGRTVERLEVAGLGPGAPVLPGVSRLPAVGQYYASPALAAMLRSVPRDELGSRFPGRLAGTIGDQALASPSDLVIYIGETPSRLGVQASTMRVDAIAATHGKQIWSPYFQAAFAVGAAAFLFPILILIGTATRLSAARREERFAALRLVGATSAQIGVIAAVDAAVSALLGAVLGIGLFLVLQPELVTTAFTSARYFAADVTPTIWGYLGMLLAVPAASAAAALLSLRRVRISPLGVARSVTPRAPSTWRLVPLIAGLVLFAVGMALSGSKSIGAAAYPGLLLVMIGLVFGGSWLTDRAARLAPRLARGAAPLLAGRRLADNPKAAFRSIRGLVLAVFLGTMVAGLIPFANATTATPSARSLTNVMLDEFIVSPVCGNDVNCTGNSPGDIAATTSAREQVIEANGLPPQAGATLLRQLRAFRGTSVYPIYSLPARHGRPGPGGYNGIISCASLRQLAVLGSCPAGARAVEANTMNLYGDNPSDTTEPIAGAHNPAGSDDASGLYLQAVLIRVPSEAMLERVRTFLATHTPLSASGAAPRTFGEAVQARVAVGDTVQRLIDLAVALTLLVAGCSLAVAIGGGLLERKRPFTLMRVSGTPLATLARVVILEAVVPLIAATVVAAGTAYGMSALAVARLASKGTPLPVLGHGYYLTMTAGLLVSLTMITAALPLLGRMTTPASVRFE
ncbi:MAG TPA: FtsX-like permease family protein [Streptosporangiaceae bacterium]|nr:FtsX-like permease family protein [Streptosporangiaceae bacterium]